MQIKTPCCKLYLQQGAEKQIEQLSVSFIRTIPSAPESHRISGCINSRSRACGNAIYRRWGIAPRPETNFLTKSIARYCGAVKPPFQKVCTFFVKVRFHLSFLAPGGRVCYHNMRCEKTQEVFHDFLDP